MKIIGYIKYIKYITANENEDRNIISPRFK